MVLNEVAKNEDIVLSKFAPSDIRRIVDTIGYKDILSVQDYLKLYNKIMVQSEEGAKYLNDLLDDIGKFYYTISPRYIR